MSDIYRCGPFQISNVLGDISLFKLRGTLDPDSVVFRKNYIWDRLDISWSQVKILLNNKEIRLPP